MSSDVVLPTNVGVCAISTDVLHKLMRLPVSVKIIALTQSRVDWQKDRFRIVIEAEEFAMMDTPMHSDGTRSAAPQVLPVYKSDKKNKAHWAGWQLVPYADDDEDTVDDLDDYHQW